MWKVLESEGNMRYPYKLQLDGRKMTEEWIWVIMGSEIARERKRRSPSFL